MTESIGRAVVTLVAGEWHLDTSFHRSASGFDEDGGQVERSGIVMYSLAVTGSSLT